ncbi:hypothetical protein [Thalassoglobus sp.]|uniref:hypothetical protein n=1 Tax=Thalassoglobus sp. TaxID=2795869 RepID=UPI003AA9D0DB
MKLLKRKPRYFVERIRSNVKASLYWKLEGKKYVLYVDLAFRSKWNWKSLGSFRFADLKDVRMACQDCSLVFNTGILGER